MSRPRSLCFLHNAPDVFKVVEPAICGRFITNAPPNAFLHIQPRLIRRQVFKMETRMLLKIKFNNVAAMPAGTIYKKPDSTMPKRSIKMTQNLKKTFAVAPFGANHALAPQQRRNPSGHIQAFLMLAGRWNLKAATFLAPAASQTRMQRKAGFILKDDCFFRLQPAKFFLKPSETSSRPHSSPEYKSNWLASSGIPSDASTAGPDALSDLCQNTFSNERQPSDRPSETCSAQSPEAFFPNVHKALAEPCFPSSLAVQDAALASGIPAPLHLRRASIDSGSCGSSPARRLSNLVVGPQLPATRRLSLCRSMRREFCRPLLTAFLSLRQRALRLRLDFSCLHTNMKNPLCNII